MTAYRDRLNAGHHTAPDPNAEPTKAELQDRLRALNLPITGSKAELEQRLADAQQNA